MHIFFNSAVIGDNYLELQRVMFAFPTNVSAIHDSFPAFRFSVIPQIKFFEKANLPPCKMLLTKSFFLVNLALLKAIFKLTKINNQSE
jgi:hypothetical protein